MVDKVSNSELMLVVKLFRKVRRAALHNAPMATYVPEKMQGFVSF